MVAENHVEIYNEISLQHEFGIFLRNAQQESKVQFERNVSFFFNSTDAFLKKEIDLAVFAADKKTLHYAIEFKYPRNGQYPVQMYSFCEDIAFLEQLKKAGFAKGYFIAFTDQTLFYEEGLNNGGIYEYFRKGKVLTGLIQKPTGNKDKSVTLEGKYKVEWNTVNEILKYMLVEI